MIWVAGRIVRAEELHIGVLDRTFEHGLGLFETFRTWRGEAPMLPRHLARLRRSAAELGLPVAPEALPDADAVRSLVRAQGEGDVLLRLTLSGGTSASGGSTLWMRAAPLPARTSEGGLAVALGSWPVERDDPLARHKSINYWRRRLAHEEAVRRGFGEVLSHTAGPLYWEGSRTNLFAIRDGALLTPSTAGPIVPGIMRGLVLELAAEVGLAVRETDGLSRDDLHAADEVFLTNSVRGIVPVARLDAGDDAAWDAPEGWTKRLASRFEAWIGAGEIAS